MLAVGTGGEAGRLSHLVPQRGVKRAASAWGQAEATARAFSQLSRSSLTQSHRLALFLHPRHTWSDTSEDLPGDSSCLFCDLSDRDVFAENLDLITCRDRRVS